MGAVYDVLNYHMIKENSMRIVWSQLTMNTTLDRASLVTLKLSRSSSWGWEFLKVNPVGNSLEFHVIFLGFRQISPWSFHGLFLPFPPFRGRHSGQGRQGLVFRSAGTMTLTISWYPFFVMIWLVVWTPLKNISQLGWLFQIYGKIKNVPNHQPVNYRYHSQEIFSKCESWWPGGHKEMLATHHLPDGLHIPVLTATGLVLLLAFLVLFIIFLVLDTGDNSSAMTEL